MMNFGRNSVFMKKTIKIPYWERNFKFIILGCLLFFLLFLFIGKYFLEYKLNSMDFTSWLPFESRQANAAISESDKIWISGLEARYGFSMDEVLLLTQLLDGDYRISGDGEFTINRTDPNYHEIYKVLCVVMNRVRSDKFPNTVSEVVLAKNQFHVFPKNLRTIPHWKSFLIVFNWCSRYDLYDFKIQVIPEDHLYFYGDGKINHTRKGH